MLHGFKYCITSLLAILALVHCENIDSTPIIGVLTQEVSRLIENHFPEQYNSYIAASYVKFVEGGGGRVVPIWIGQPKEYYVDIMKKINGVLLPGGATFFNQSNGYADAGKHIYDIAIELNNLGTYFPVWGTCLGYELLVYLSSNGTDLRTDCFSQSQPLPLEFVKEFKNSRLFGDADDSLIDIFATQNVTSNFHMYCYTVETFKSHKLDQSWKILSLNHDLNNDEFISTVEHTRYPFYGVQFHPEKNLYEFVKNKKIMHNSNSTKTSQYFAAFLINESRKNNHSFLNATEETEALIYNYQPKYTGALGSAFVQQYLFPKENSAYMRTMSVALIVFCLILGKFVNF